ncbi:MAG TPA: MBL fold metallo-hydrolase [Candidatus Sulfotelmatobacter sp.]|nr:MBL fold metallo-hydrolase [Candidatus Sulfotelmatobacter sp.]
MQVPVVDGLAVSVVVENSYDGLATGGRFGSARVERTATPRGGDPRPRLLAEHGFALLVESWRGPERRAVLVDFSARASTLLNNLEALGADVGRFDALFLSHGHDDHYGGLLAFLEAARPRLRPDLPLHVGGPDTFAHRWGVEEDGKRVDYGQLRRERIEAHGVRIEMPGAPALVAGHGLSSGPIPRRTPFETVPARFRVEEGGELLPDGFHGEHALGFHVRGRGLVVLTSCGHAGVINSVRHLQEVAGVDSVYAILGGFHLAGAKEERIVRTLAGFRELAPEVLVPMHCAGMRITFELYREMPDRFVPNTTGSRYIFEGA